MERTSAGASTWQHMCVREFAMLTRAGGKWMNANASKENMEFAILKIQSFTNLEINNLVSFL